MRKSKVGKRVGDEVTTEVDFIVAEIEIQGVSGGFVTLSINGYLVVCGPGEHITITQAREARCVIRETA